MAFAALGDGYAATRKNRAAEDRTRVSGFVVNKLGMLTTRPPRLNSFSNNFKKKEAPLFYSLSRSVPRARAILKGLLLLGKLTL